MGPCARALGRQRSSQPGERFQSCAGRGSSRIAMGRGAAGEVHQSRQRLRLAPAHSKATFMQYDPNNPQSAQPARASGAWPALAASGPARAPGVKGAPVWLDMDQQELDDAYDQIVYAPNRDQIGKRRVANSEKARAVLG